MDILNLAMIYLLDTFHTIAGSYGLAIIMVTVLIRLVLWPLNTAQNRSMKKMQELQPKLKELQERHKNDPQKLQQEMIKIYTETKFNPMMGCLPMLIQLPIFIALYGALNSPEFMVKAGQEQFLFIEKLQNTLQSKSGPSLDGKFSIGAEDHFTTGKTMKLFLSNGKVIEKSIGDPANTLGIRPQPAIPGEPMTFSIGFDLLNLSKDYEKLTDHAEISVVNNSSREVEVLNMKPRGPWFVEKLPTVEGVHRFHADVLMLLLLYVLMSFGYQKVMERKMPKPQDPAQAQMAKLLPLLFVGVLFFIPLPAGVLLYLVSTMALMLIQTVLDWTLGDKNAASPLVNVPGKQVVDIKPQP